MKTQNLEYRFKTLIEAMSFKQLKKVGKSNESSSEFMEIASYFQTLLEQESITLSDITEYKKLYKIKSDTFALSLNTLAKECAKLFCAYLDSMYLPDETKGVFVGCVYLAGTQYVPNITQLYNALKIGDTVEIVRERENPHDTKAVKVVTSNGEKLGYIPRNHNLFLSQMLDFDIKLTAEIKKLKWSIKEVAIKVMIYQDMR